VANVAHDVRNSLGAALARIQLIERRVRRGDVDCARLAGDLGAVEDDLRQAATRVDGLAAHPPVTHGPLAERQSADGSDAPQRARGGPQEMC
jgi:hypothetical protein